MEYTEKMMDDIEKTFCDIRMVYSIIQKLQNNGYRCTPAEGILLSGIMKKSHWSPFTVYVSIVKE